MWIFINLIIALIAMPIVINKHNWNFLSCAVYLMLCLMFTPLGGIPVYKILGG